MQAYVELEREEERNGGTKTTRISAMLKYVSLQMLPTNTEMRSMYSWCNEYWWSPFIFDVFCILFPRCLFLGLFFFLSFPSPGSSRFNSRTSVTIPPLIRFWTFFPESLSVQKNNSQKASECYNSPGKVNFAVRSRQANQQTSTRIQKASTMSDGVNSLLKGISF